MQINEQVHDQKKMKTKYERLDQQIKSFMPDQYAN